VRNALAQIAASTVPHPDHHDHEGAHDHDAAPAAPAAVEILDIPVATATREPRRVSPDADQLLDTVLEALPEPKKPGQGRSRRARRASSAGTVTPPTAD
jgi:ribonuclease E